MIKRYWQEMTACGLLLTVGGGMLWGLAESPSPHEVEMAGYATSLRGRTGSQRHNAVKAADALDGKIIAPGAIFSFNATVKSWSQDQGFVKAPVSFDGELIKAYGGGVCQTSTTLYNAALLAGLPILERHAHVFAPHYVPPGQDAAVAQRNIDLRFRNPYAWPLRLRAGAQGDHLEVKILGANPVPQTVHVTTDILSSSAPARLTRVVYRSPGSAGRAYVRNPGATGYRVLAYRTFLPDTSPSGDLPGMTVRRERLSDDSYQAMDRIVQLNHLNDRSAQDETPAP
jgi:vancomycin resistance protein VanW